MSEVRNVRGHDLTAPDGDRRRVETDSVAAMRVGEIWLSDFVSACTSTMKIVRFSFEMIPGATQVRMRMFREC